MKFINFLLRYKNSVFPLVWGFLEKRGGMNKTKVFHIAHVQMCEDAILIIPTSPYYGSPYLILFDLITIGQLPRVSRED